MHLLTEDNGIFVKQSVEQSTLYFIFGLAWSALVEWRVTYWGELSEIPSNHNGYPSKGCVLFGRSCLSQSPVNSMKHGLAHHAFLINDDELQVTQLHL